MGTAQLTGGPRDVGSICRRESSSTCGKGGISKSPNEHLKVLGISPSATRMVRSCAVKAYSQKWMLQTSAELEREQARSRAVRLKILKSCSQAISLGLLSSFRQDLERLNERPPIESQSWLVGMPTHFFGRS